MNVDAVHREFLSRIEAKRWPLPHEADVHAMLARWIAHFEADSGVLETLHPGWRLHRGGARRHYHVDPLGPKIAQGWADLLFGAAPEFTAAAEGDQDRLDDLLKASRLPAHLRRAEEVCSSEGEVWWRIYVDAELAPFPLIEFHSRIDVLPLYLGAHLAACAYVTRLEAKRGQSAESAIWRLLEVHLPGEVRNELFKGTKDNLGDHVDLAQGGDETARLVPRWVHGMPGMLAGRVVNRLGRDPRLGVSDFARIEDDLFTLNEASTIGHENMRLAGKHRVAVSADQIDESRGVWDAGEDVIPLSSDHGLVGENNPVGAPTILEYTYHPAELIAWQDNVVKRAATRSDMTPQWIGVEDVSGQAESGTALRTRLIPTVVAGEGRGRFWDEELPNVLRLLQLLDAAPTTALGFGRPWSDPSSVPAVERRPSIPPDPLEQTANDVELVTAEIESRRTVRERQHPEWDEERQVMEDGRIRRERDASVQNLGLGFGPVRPEGQGEGPPETG